MRKLLNKPWFVASLAIAAVGFVGHSLMSQLGGYGAGASSVPEAEASAETEQEPGTTGTVRRSINESLKDLTLNPAPRDPFSPRAKPESAVQAAVEKVAELDALDTVKLSALWMQAGVTYLLINDRVVTPGESIGRITLESSTADGVWITHWKGRDFLKIGGTFTLTTPARQAAAMTTSAVPSDS